MHLHQTASHACSSQLPAGEGFGCLDFRVLRSILQISSFSSDFPGTCAVLRVLELMSNSLSDTKQTWLKAGTEA